MIAIRPVESDADFQTWAAVKSAVLPNEPVTAEQIRTTTEEDRLLVLAELDGAVAGCGVAARSHFEGHGFVAPRVLPRHRGRGVGTALMAVLADHVRTLDRHALITFVYANEPRSIAFAERFGLRETDYQLEQVRRVGTEPAPEPPPGVELVSLEDRREELLRTIWPVALDGYKDMPLPGDVRFELDEWLRDEATRPDGSFVALENGEPVGYAGLLEHANGAAVAEHGLTTVRRDRRGHGIAGALKRAQLHWASQHGVVELITWTQKGNEQMQALNRRLGYRDTAHVLTFQGPLPDE